MPPWSCWFVQCEVSHLPREVESWKLKVGRGAPRISVPRRDFERRAAASDAFGQPLRQAGIEAREALQLLLGGPEVVLQAMEAELRVPPGDVAGPRVVVAGLPHRAD